jgi:hypothetical protein
MLASAVYKSSPEYQHPFFLWVQVSKPPCSLHLSENFNTTTVKLYLCCKDCPLAYSVAMLLMVLDAMNDALNPLFDVGLDY